MPRDDPRFLGTGWSFPPRFDLEFDHGAPSVGRLAMVSGDTDIRQSLTVLMTTIRGERLLDPDYGFGAQDLVFDPTDATSLMHFESQIREAVLFFEPRIRLEEVHFDASAVADGVLSIQLDYVIPQVNSRANMVFPFYFKEGTTLTQG
jgi:phage baseplate assembly protein W